MLPLCPPTPVSIKRLFYFMGSDQIQPTEGVARWGEESELRDVFPGCSPCHIALDFLHPSSQGTAPARQPSPSSYSLASCNHSLLLTL